MGQQTPHMRRLLLAALRCSLLLLLLHAICIEPFESSDGTSGDPSHKLENNKRESGASRKARGAEDASGASDVSKHVPSDGPAGGDALDAFLKTGSSSSIDSNNSGGNSSKNSGKEGLSLNLLHLLWEPLTDTGESRRLFDSCVAAEAPILLDFNHRPLLQGITPELKEVEEENERLRRRVSPIQIPEYASSSSSKPLQQQQYWDEISDDKPLGLQVEESNSSGSKFYWVPLAQRQARSWWVDKFTWNPAVDPSGESAGSSGKATSRVALGPQPPSSLSLGDVVEVFDLRDFGTSALYHPEAYGDQLQCGGLYSPVYLMDKPLGPLAAACSFRHLSAFAEKMGQLVRLHAAGSNSRLPPASPVAAVPPAAFSLGEEDAAAAAELEAAAAPSNEASAAESESVVELADERLFEGEELDGTNATSAEELRSSMGGYDPTRKWWHGLVTSPYGLLPDRPNVAKALFQLKGRVWPEVKAAEDLFFPIAALHALQRNRGPEPVVFSLASSIFNCRAHLPYRLLPSIGRRTVERFAAPPSPLLELFNKHQATVDIPLEMRALGGEVFADGRQFKGSRRLERVHRLYFRSALVLWQFAYYAYRISDLIDDYTNAPLDEVLLKHFIPSYVGTALFSENALMHSVGGRLTEAGSRALSNSNLKLVRSIGFPPRVVRASRSPEASSLGATEPYILDERTRELVDAKAVPSLSEIVGNPKPPHTIVQDKRLPSINPDVCDRDATHRMTIPAPLVFRWDLNLKSSPAAGDSPAAAKKTASAASATAEAAAGSDSAFGNVATLPSLVLNVDEDVGIGASDRDGQQPREGETLAIPVHRADVIWAFKGTGQPKQWTFNTMVGAIRDPFFSPNAWVHSGLNFLFHQTIRKPMTRFVHEVKLILRRRSRSKSTKEKPFVVVFTGHSQGGASASYAAWFVSKHLSAFVKKGLVAVYCITFASPMIGDKAAIEELNRHGAIYHHIVLDVDPVPDLRQSKGKGYMERDWEHTVVIPLHSLARAHVFERKGGDILYSGLCWLDESVRVGSRLRRVVGYASRVTGLKKYFKFKQSMTLVWTHVHALPCSITLLADLLPEATWSSFCSSPFIHTWLGRPYVAGPELDIALETTWRQEVPGMALRMKRKLKMDKNFLDTAAAEVEKAYQAASERDRHRDL